MNTKTKKIVVAALLASLACAATLMIKIPSPLKGYINLGDCVVLVSGWLLTPVWGFLAAGIGSALADIISGYVIYAPATFLIKGIMAIVAYYIFGLLRGRCGNVVSRIIGGIAAEMLMIIGYYLFAGYLYGFGPAAVNIPANAVQGVAGILVGLVLIRAVEKSKIVVK